MRAWNTHKQSNKVTFSQWTYGTSRPSYKCQCQCQSRIVRVARTASLNCCNSHENALQIFKLKCQKMTGETRMSLAVAGIRRQTVQTAHHLAECSRKWRLRQETSDDRLLIDGTAGRAAAAWTTTADGDDLAGLIPERVDLDRVAPYRYERSFKVDSFRQKQAVQYREGVSRGQTRGRKRQSQNTKRAADCRRR